MTRPPPRDNAIQTLIEGTAHLDAEARGIALFLLLRSMHRQTPDMAVNLANAALAATDTKTLVEVLSRLPAELAQVADDRQLVHFPIVKDALERHARLSQTRREAAVLRWSKRDEHDGPTAIVPAPIGSAQPSSTTTDKPATSTIAPDHRGAAAPRPAPRPAAPIAGSSDLFNGQSAAALTTIASRQKTRRPSSTVGPYQRLMSLVTQLCQRPDWPDNTSSTRRAISALWSKTYRDSDPKALISAVSQCCALATVPDRPIGWITTIARDNATDATRRANRRAASPAGLRTTIHAPAIAGLVLGLSAGSREAMAETAQSLRNLDLLGEGKQ